MRAFLRKFYGNRMLSCVRFYDGIAGMGDGEDIKSNQTLKEPQMTIASIETTNIPTANKSSFLLRALNWLAKLDGDYREAAKLKTMPQERLDDMGMSRNSLKEQFSGKLPRR